MIDQAAWEPVLEVLAGQFHDFLDSNIQAVVDNAIDNPDTLLDLTDGQREELLALYELAVDETHDGTVVEVNDFIGEQHDSQVPAEAVSEAKIIGGYFVLEAIRRSFHRFHGSQTARQLDGFDREEAFTDAMVTSKADIKSISSAELAVSYRDFTKAHQSALGFAGYTWRTVGDENVRDSHRALDGKKV